MALSSPGLVPMKRKVLSTGAILSATCAISFPDPIPRPYSQTLFPDPIFIHVSKKGLATVEYFLDVMSSVATLCDHDWLQV